MIGRTVVLEMLRPELFGDEHRARETLERELRAARRVDHHNVVRVLDVGSAPGGPFVATEDVEGTSLAALLADDGALSADVVLALAGQLLRALAAVHAHGGVHGDLVPSNLVVTADGLLKLSGLGVSSLARRRPPGRPGESSDEEIETPRLAGAVVGAPEYMAPELLVGGAADARSDLYAAGVILHECLTGATPFPREAPSAFLARKLDPPHAAAPVGGASPDVASLDGLIAWMTAPDPSDRPASAAEVEAALARLGADRE
jgi:serine/threonine-protein kinase